MTAQALESRLFIEEPFELAECPFWFEDRLWWVDIPSGRLNSADGAGKDRTSFGLGTRLGAAVPLGGTHFLVAVEEGIGLWDRRAGSLEMVATPEKEVPGSRFNDGKCDRAGRFVAGTLNMHSRPNASALYSLHPDGSVHRLLSGVGLSNGLTWSLDGKLLYHIDSHTREIAAFPYDLRTGEIGERRVVVRVPPELGIPDGMEIDARGNLWVAHWGGWAVRCWSPISGECLAEIRVPCAQPTSCCFGGTDYHRLFITSARDEISSEDLTAQPLAGSVFVCEPGVTGFPLNPAAPAFRTA